MLPVRRGQQPQWIPQPLFGASRGHRLQAQASPCHCSLRLVREGQGFGEPGCTGRGAVSPKPHGLGHGWGRVWPPHPCRAGEGTECSQGGSPSPMLLSWGPAGSRCSFKEAFNLLSGHCAHPAVPRRTSPCWWQRPMGPNPLLLSVTTLPGRREGRTQMCQARPHNEVAPQMFPGTPPCCGGRVGSAPPGSALWAPNGGPEEESGAGCRASDDFPVSPRPPMPHNLLQVPPPCARVR